MTNSLQVEMLRCVCMEWQPDFFFKEKNLTTILAERDFTKTVAHALPNHLVETLCNCTQNFQKFSTVMETQLILQQSFNMLTR